MKLIVFMPIIIFFAIFGLLVLAFIAFVLKIMKKTAESSWKGEVIDKSSHVKRGMGDERDETFLTLVVTTDEGLTRNIAVSRQMYDSCNVGDKLEKPKGKLNPIKVS
jgi:hypothetical protein